MELGDEASWVGEVHYVAEHNYLRLERWHCPFWNALSEKNWHSGVRFGCDGKGHGRVCGGPKEEL